MGDTNSFRTSSEVIQAILHEIGAGFPERAAELYSRCQDDIGYSLISVLPRDQRVRRAVAKMFYLAKDFEKAALIFEQAEEFDKAALLYERCEDFAMAAEMYSRVEQFERAAAMFEKAGDFEQAAQLFTQLGDYDRAAVNFERAINNFLAGKMYFKLGKYNKAIELLQKVKYGERSYFEAVAMIGAILARNGYLDMAVRKYESVVKEASLDDSSIEIYYDLAKLYAQKGNFHLAVEVLERVVDHDLRYKDAVERLAQYRAAQPSTALVAPVANEESASGCIVSVMQGFEFLKGTPLFEELSLQEMKSLFYIAETRAFHAGQILIEQDQPGCSLFILKSGKVKVERIEGNCVRPLAELASGAHVGEMSLIDAAPTSARVTAIEPTEAFEILREKFDKLMAANDRLYAKVTRSFIRTLNERLRKTSKEYSEYRKVQEQMLANLFPESSS